MTSPSPSDFLTFSRRLLTHPAVRRGFAPQPARFSPLSARPFSNSVVRSKKLSTDASVDRSEFPDDKHATDKKPSEDVHAESSAKGRDAHAKDEGGTATQQRDSTNSTQRTKQEHPEAPDVVIGMQDERGAKGRS